MIKSLLIAILVFGLSCCSSPQKTHVNIHIALINNKQSLQFTGLDPSVMGEISRDSTGNGWLGLVPVYRMPADTDLKTFQPEQPGQYRVAGNALVFTPDTPFVKGQNYFVRWHHVDDNAKPTSFLSGSRQLGKIQFTDLIFKQ
ncbi:hypothetical protein A0256_04395 [Mucilaginibacter sp. PAMC 26640]|nr:hypothetical protein A0256_04395 [Mucilaginibacter sp. PAMC 26640]